MRTVSHSQLIRCLREFADDLEAMPEHNRINVYQVGGASERLFECGLWIRAEVTNEQCLSRTRLNHNS